VNLRRLLALPFLIIAEICLGLAEAIAGEDLWL
jgi:hypothetical protein